jgi:hypothetical protein
VNYLNALEWVARETFYITVNTMMTGRKWTILDHSMRIDELYRMEMVQRLDKPSIVV